MSETGEGDTFAEQFRSALLASGLDRLQAAQRLRVSPTTVDRWASGQSAPHTIGRVSVFDALLGETSG